MKLNSDSCQAETNDEGYFWQSIFVLESKITGVSVSVYLINLISSFECTFQYQVIMLHETTHIISQEKQLQKS